MTKIPAKGTQLQIGDGAPTEQFTKIVQLSRIGGLEINQETEDTTDHDSTDFYREHIETLAAVGDIPFEGHWDPADATHVDVQTKAGSGGGPYNFKIIFPDTDATTADFAASITNLKMGDAPVDGKLPIAGTLKVSGKIEWT